MALRSDMDVYARSCSQLTNFNVAATGGISRRRGMRYITNALPADSRLIPFRYSSSLSYLIELSHDTLIVRESESPFQEIDRFSGGSVWNYTDLNLVSWQQCNSILLICSANTPVMQLKLESDGSWTFQRYQFKCPPWQTTDLRDSDITMTPAGGQLYSVSFDEDEDDDDDDCEVGDLLRVSFYTTKADSFVPSATLRSGSWSTFDSASAGITSDSSFEVGDRIAVVSNLISECFVCTSKWQGSNDFTQGCTSPENYKENFIRAEDLSGFDDVSGIYELDLGQTYEKGDKVKIISGYWTFYECVREFTPPDFVAGHSSPRDYPAHFISGCAVGDAIPCKGPWKFYCSGTWYGSYEVRRSYEDPDLTASWETLGESCSYIGSPENNLISGSEESEECYLRLFLTSIRYKGSTSWAACWPGDECANRLIIPSYKHDTILQLTADDFWLDKSAVPIPQSSPIKTDDWSWAAFNSRFGYPSLAALHQSRLVLAATRLQPQTIWMSRVDDINNFDDSDGDDSSLLLTMNTTTQASICWICSRRDDLQVGTEDGEWLIPTNNSSRITAEAIRIVNHGMRGSAHIPPIQADDHVLYCERGSARVYQYGYHYESDGYRSEDMTIFADHIAESAGGIVSGTIQNKPYCCAIFVMADGSLALMTYNTFHNVNAWHRYTTSGRVESVCSLPSGTHPDKLFLITQRETGRYLEVIDDSSGYLDADGLDYISTMETTAFDAPDRDDVEQLDAPLRAYITTSTPANLISVSTGSRPYSPISYRGNIFPGWVKMLSLSGWSDSRKIGIQVHGDSPFELLCVQL